MSRPAAPRNLTDAARAKRPRGRFHQALHRFEPCTKHAIARSPRAADELDRRGQAPLEIAHDVRDLLGHVALHQEVDAERWRPAACGGARRGLPDEFARERAAVPLLPDLEAGGSQQGRPQRRLLARCPRVPAMTSSSLASAVWLRSRRYDRKPSLDGRVVRDGHFEGLKRVRELSSTAKRSFTPSWPWKPSERCSTKPSAPR
jgi:hypothetical protein